MFLASLLLSAAAAAQAPQATPIQQASVSASRGAGRLFISPMGEPFYGRTAGEDGLVVWFQQADANHDGMLTAEEMAADADRFFKVLDRNHDGEIDPDEISYYESSIAPQLRVAPIISTSTLPGGEVEEHVDDETNAGRMGLLQIPEPVSSADTNFDRGVSPQEFRTAALARFQLLDTSQTGQLSLAALQSTRHAASTVAKRKKDIKPGESDDPHSAEYGAPSTPQ
jgi:Ca2+-binding EF-hand superfamily protein